ncbi:hypothetical protein AB0H76_36225 [Nocardia sp. NPDC050712]|uniref:hypothetical protein n=1 Tax=Nocardia sp. NPDC050712 TaxID=3155518 RepID=UPI0033D66AAB
MTVFQIARRFNGPPGSGNGGYVGGLLAQRHPAPVVTVMLRNKPPLETELRVRDGNLFDGATLIAESRAGAFERDVPQPVPYQRAEAAAGSYQSNEMFASCFVCGSGRADGLRIEAGAIGAGLVAAPWSPDDSLPIGTELLWAAMDCPGGWSLDGMFERPALLGSMTAAVYDLPAVGEKCVVVGQNHGDQGRKSFAATAVYGSDERLLGRAEQIWIRLSV